MTSTHGIINDDLLTIEYALKRQFAFTLRRTNLKKGVCEDDYTLHIYKFENHGCKLIDYSFEKTAGLHMHGILEIPLQFDYQKRMRIRGWNMKIVELFDSDGWKQYYLKDQITDLQNRISHEIEDDDDASAVIDSNLYRLHHSLFKR